MEIKRTYHKIEILKDGYNGFEKKTIPADNELEANLIGSKIHQSGLEHDYEMPQLHAPVLDIDFPARLLPSSTDEHYHLYLDKPMTWWRYKRLLKALYKAGIIEKGYWKGSLKQKQSLVRKPGVYKNPPPVEKNHLIRLEEIKSAFNKLVEDIKPAN